MRCHEEQLIDRVSDLEAERDKLKSVVDRQSRMLDEIFGWAQVDTLADLELVVLAGVVHRERCR